MLKSICGKIRLLSLPLRKLEMPMRIMNFRYVTSTSSSTESEDEKGIFVSSHYLVGKEEIIQFLSKFKLEHKVRPSGQIVTKTCPLCAKPHYNKPDNLWTLNIKSSSGAFFCFRCGHNGSWFDFKNMISVGEPVRLSKATENPTELPKKADEATSFLYYKNLVLDSFPESSQYLLENRKLNMDTLKTYKVGLGEEKFINEDGELVSVPVVYFPMFRTRSKKEKEKYLKSLNKSENLIESISNEFSFLVRNKVRGIGKENKHFQKLKPSPGYHGIFGINLLTPATKEIVITEGEYDAMAVYQSTGIVSLSLPNGAHHLPIDILPWLEKVEKIYLWLDADEVGRANCSKIAEKLGIMRTFIVDSRQNDPEGPKDANDALRANPESIPFFLSKARLVNQEYITTFSELRENVLNRILRHEENQGIKFTTFHWLNKKLKGFRRGELSVITGLTGSGKTTILSQISLDICGKGVPTLWGSFEIKNEILLTNMLLQFSGTDLVKEPQKFEFHADRFEMIPLYFMKFFGSCELDKLIATIEAAIYSYDIGHVIIDNLQFLLSGQARGFERFELQDESISRFRRLATENNVHVSLVIHPKKVEDTADLNISSVFGTAKATQEADNVFIIQTRRKYKVLELKKNRFDGEVGACALGFQKESKRFLELKEGEVERMERERDYLFSDVLEERKIKNEQDDVSFASEHFLDELKAKQKTQEEQMQRFVISSAAEEKEVHEEEILAQYFKKEPVIEKEKEKEKEDVYDSGVPTWFNEYERISSFYSNPSEIPSKGRIDNIISQSSDVSSKRKAPKIPLEENLKSDDFYLRKKNN